MSDMPNGNPPGQNNLDATVERYVDPKNDPSAMAQKSDQERPQSDGIETEPLEIHPDTQAELDQAARNIVEPSTAETPKPAPKAEPKK